MTSDDIIKMYAGECFIKTVILQVAIIFLFLIVNRKILNIKKIVIPKFLWTMMLINMFIFIGHAAAITFKPATYDYKVVKPAPEVITRVNTIEKEVIIDAPSIVLPITPEGKQAIVIDTNSKKLEHFIKEFYGQNVEFFNQRQDATFLIKDSKFENYTALNISDIEYKDTEFSKVNFDKLGFDTIWLFSDLTNIELLPMECKVILYTPQQLSQEEIKEIKTKGNITVISIEQF